MLFPMILFLMTLVGGCGGAAAPVEPDPSVNGAERTNAASVRAIGDRAMRYLESICALGPRPSGSEGMQRQQELLRDHFEPLVTRTGGTVSMQRFMGRDPRDGSDREYANFIVEWYPERRDRILLCAHYDTLPYPMRDPIEPRGIFIGANDGASGVAVLMAIGDDLAAGAAADMGTGDGTGKATGTAAGGDGFRVPFGVDFVFFDAEEFRFRTDDPFFLGSTYFAEQVRDGMIRTCPTGDATVSATDGERVTYHAAVLLDMVGGTGMKIFQERYSLSWPEAVPLVREIWGVAGRLGMREFVARPKHWIQDDHVPLYEIAGIPACDVIDFDYPAWHTRGDVPSRCSPRSLGVVGRVIREWLRTTKMVPSR